MRKSHDKLAREAAQACAAGDKTRMRELLQTAIESGGEHRARGIFVIFCAELAGKARREGEHGQVCRLREAMYEHKPAGLARTIIRSLLVSAGAAGYLPRQPRPRRVFSSVHTVNG